MTPVRTPVSAQLDIIEAANWYDARQAGIGRQFFAAVDDALDRIGRLPRAYPRVAAGRRRETRQAMLSGFPYLITFEVLPAEVVILSVTHARSSHRPWVRRQP